MNSTPTPSGMTEATITLDWMHEVDARLTRIEDRLHAELEQREAQRAEYEARLSVLEKTVQTLVEWAAFVETRLTELLTYTKEIITHLGSK